MGATLNPFEMSKYKLDGYYIATVANNDDPKHIGRIQLKQPVLFGNEMPWAIPVVVRTLGAGAAFGSFSIPEEGSEVYIQFQNEDIHFPMYVGTVWVPGQVPEELLINYPNRYGIVDETGNALIVDKQAHTMQLTHSSGSQANIDEAGNISVSSVANVSVTAAQELTLNAPTINIEASSVVNIKTPTVNTTE